MFNVFVWTRIGSVVTRDPSTAAGTQVRFWLAEGSLGGLQLGGAGNGACAFTDGKGTRHICAWPREAHTVLPIIHWYKRKENFLSSHIRKFRRKQLQSHIWLTVSSYMTKYFHISSYIRKLFLIDDFDTAPFWIYLYMRKIFSFFLIIAAPVHLVRSRRNLLTLSLITKRKLRKIWGVKKSLGPLEKPLEITDFVFCSHKKINLQHD